MLDKVFEKCIYDGIYSDAFFSTCICDHIYSGKNCWHISSLGRLDSDHFLLLVSPCSILKGSILDLLARSSNKRSCDVPDELDDLIRSFWGRIVSTVDSRELD